MAFGRKNPEEIITAETKVWACSSEDCNCWVRDNFKSSEVPKCPICHSEMEQEVRTLEVVNNHSQKLNAKAE
ncbi:cold-shock protein [Mesobacillus harenae]|uniref:cold-shock protein n=1 Tax=Mesobacillus harenae TaxID=2213203 RepID=UPI00157FCC14|nr:cold-shock protein [Mesobacillus harenae]